MIQSVFNEEKLTLHFHLTEEGIKLHFQATLNNGKEKLTLHQVKSDNAK